MRELAGPSLTDLTVRTGEEFKSRGINGSQRRMKTQFKMKCVLASLVILASGTAPVLGDQTGAKQYGNVTFFADRVPTTDEILAILGSDAATTDTPSSQDIDPSLISLQKIKLTTEEEDVSNRRRVPDSSAVKQNSTASSTPLTPRPNRIATPIRFKLNSAQLLSDHDQFIQRFAEALERDTDLSYVVLGHADATGPASYNLTLSQKRAESVVAQLVTVYSIDPSRLTAVGRGETEPLVGLSPVHGDNRRVEFMKR